MTQDRFSLPSFDCLISPRTCSSMGTVPKSWAYMYLPPTVAYGPFTELLHTKNIFFPG